MVGRGVYRRVFIFKLYTVSIYIYTTNFKLLLIYLLQITSYSAILID